MIIWTFPHNQWKVSNATEESYFYYILLSRPRPYQNLAVRYATGLGQSQAMWIWPAAYQSMEINCHTETFSCVRRWIVLHEKHKKMKIVVSTTKYSKLRLISPRNITEEQRSGQNEASLFDRGWGVSVGGSSGELSNHWQDRGVSIHQCEPRWWNGSGCSILVVETYFTWIVLFPWVVRAVLLVALLSFVCKRLPEIKQRWEGLQKLETYPALSWQNGGARSVGTQIVP